MAFLDVACGNVLLWTELPSGVRQPMEISDCCQGRKQEQAVRLCPCRLVASLLLPPLSCFSFVTFSFCVHPLTTVVTQHCNVTSAFMCHALGSVLSMAKAKAAVLLWLTMHSCIVCSTYLTYINHCFSIYRCTCSDILIHIHCTPSEIGLSKFSSCFVRT